MGERLSGGWRYLVDERDGPPYATHAHRNCRALDDRDAELRIVLVPFLTRPPKEWESCEICGGAQLARAGETA